MDGTAKHTSIAMLRRWREGGGKLCIFCAGQNGYSAWRIFAHVGIQVDFYIDNDPGKWGRTLHDGVPCRPPADAAQDQTLLCYIAVSPALYPAIERQARGLGIVHLGVLSDIVRDLIEHDRKAFTALLDELPYNGISELFYEFNPNRLLLPDAPALAGRGARGGRIAVYTGIFGGYDQICEPQARPENIDYYFVSDERPQRLKGFQWLDAKAFLPPGLRGGFLRNRYVKTHPHILFPHYGQSIYVDGNIRILGDISNFLGDSKTGISVFMHPWRRCIFFEALQIVNYKRISGSRVAGQMLRYLDEGMPVQYGLAEMGVIAMRHNQEGCMRLMEDWWREISQYGARDQLSFMYCMWKNGYRLQDLTPLGFNIRECGKIEMRGHIRQSTREKP